METFADVDGLDIKQETAKLGFGVSRQKLITDSGIETDHDVILDTSNDNKKIGIVKQRHLTVPYIDSVGWLVNEFTSTGIDFKLRESLLMDNYDFYQEYIFDQNVDTPDGSGMSPMVLVKGSYISSPLRMDFGTFRFTCSNGIRVGQVVDRVKIRSDVGPDFLKSSITSDIHSSMNKFARVTDLYKGLEKKPMNPYLESFITDATISAFYKRIVLEMLQEQGYVGILVDKIKKDDLIHNPANVYKPTGPMTAWLFYNLLTQIATHKAQNVTGRVFFYDKISNLFGI